MAGDWIKVRVWLCRDNKTIRMADWLANEPHFTNGLGLGHLATEPGRETQMRNVTVALCVTGLVVTWGVAREQGDRVGDDLVLRHCDLNTIAAMSGVPLFGDAMAQVGWAVPGDNDSVIFPKFFKDNESPDDRHRRQNAERQAKHRDKLNNVTRDVTRNAKVTHREEKRREEKKQELAGFASFWLAWPRHHRKADKRACVARWKADDLEARADEVIAHVAAMTTSREWTEDGGKYVPAPMVYLNQQRYDAPLPNVVPISTRSTKVAM